MSENAKPLLSICIPAYNGGAYLRNVLMALLPQAAMTGSLVEVVVSDDGSSDNTQDLISLLRGQFLFRYVRNFSNIGMAPNIVNCLTKLSSGKFVWIWSQHCLLAHGALERVVGLLKTHEDLDAFYVNFRCARFPEDWPENVVGGYDGPYHYVSGDRADSVCLERWEELLSVRTALCTQTYAHILKKSLAAAYWLDKTAHKEFGTAADTFSQSTTVAETMFGKPTFYIGQPVFTIFNGAQTWASLRQRAPVYLQALPELVEIFRKHGYSGDELKKAQEYSSMMAGQVILEILRTPDCNEKKRIVGFVFSHWKQRGALQQVWASITESDCCLATRLIRKSLAAMSRWHRYWFYNCRPARWLRSRKG